MLTPNRPQDCDYQRTYQMDVLKMAFSNDRDLAVLCRPMQPRVEATPFTDSYDKIPRVTMHTLKLVSDVKSSSVCDF